MESAVSEEEHSLNLKFDDDGEKKKKGLTAGRAVNGCIICNYLLLLLCALIVAGTMGVLHDKLSRTQYQDNHEQSNRTCILFSSCVANANKTGSPPCDFYYNNSGACDLIIGGFVIIALAVICYIVASVIRIIFATNIWITVVLDILLNLGLVICLLVLGITISVGLAVTCGAINKHYGFSGWKNCSHKAVPSTGGYHFYREVSVSQGAAWFCFMFSFVSLVIFLVRSCIFCRRRAIIPSMPKSSAVLTADDNYKSSGNTPADEKPKAV